jgi:hypothetical protein
MNLKRAAGVRDSLRPPVVWQAPRLATTRIVVRSISAAPPALRAVFLLLALEACRSQAASARTDSAFTAAATTPTVVVDSVIPMGEALARFRRDLPPVASLAGGAASRDALVHRVVDALANNDTTAFERFAVTRAEYAWLYFPTTAIAHPPYELPPALAWFQLQERSRKGVTRALRELGGHRIDLRGYRCAPQPRVEGDNRIWSDCRVTVSRDGARAVTLHLFGAILERGGRFTIVSYQNDF